MKLKFIDHLGMISSTACAIHCLILPLVITSLPYLGLWFLVNETVEIVMLFTSMILASLSLCFGFKLHKNKKIFFLFSFGMALLILGNYAHDNNWGLTSVIILFVGGLTIAFSHFLNKKLCNSCKTCSVEIKNV